MKRATLSVIAMCVLATIGLVTGCSAPKSGQESTNQVNNNATSQTTPPSTTNVSSTSNTLRLYDAGTLTADHAIAWPGLPKNSNQYSASLKVVQVSFTAGVDTKKLTAPHTIRASVPKSLQGKLVAYFLQLNATTGFYLIGPAGMIAEAELAADGSDGYYLHNSDATIELDTSGGSPGVADGMGAPFFQTAQQAAIQEVPGSTSEPLAPATVTYPNKYTAYFSFADKDGQNVAGWTGYLPQSSGQSAVTMVYKSGGSDWSYAPYILQTGVNLWNNVIAPQTQGTLTRPQEATMKVGDQSIIVPNSAGRVVQTPKGIAWIWQPPVSMEGSPESPWSRVATGSYGLAFATPTKGIITESSVQIAKNIPSVRVMDGDNDVFYAFPHVSSLIDNRWLLYTVTWAVPGMNQPYSNDLHAYDIMTRNDRTITSYNDAGGMFFSVGTSGQYLVYDESGIIDAHGDEGHHLYLVDLVTGKQSTISTTHLSKPKSVDSGSVHVTVQGQVLTIPLNQW